MLLWELHKFVNRSKQLRPLWCSTVHRKSARMLYRDMCGPELEFIALRIIATQPILYAALATAPTWLPIEIIVAVVLLLHALVAFQHAALVSVQTWDRVYRAVVAVPHLLALAMYQHVAPVHVQI
ncbi:Stigma-specific protein Stig1 [Penicillium brevicompactum]